MQDWKFRIRKQKIEGGNIKLKFHIYDFDNLSKSGDEFHAVTGLTVESFNNLLEVLNLGKGSCTSSKLSRSCDDIGSPKSGPKPKLSPEDQLFMYMTW